jgi:hypothetical protein
MSRAACMATFWTDYNCERFSRVRINNIFTREKVMGIFDRGPETIKQKDFQKHVSKYTGYGSLKAAMGEEYAKKSVAALWKGVSFGATDIKVGRSDSDAMRSVINSLLQHELNSVLNGHYHIGKLKLFASMKSYSPKMQSMTMNPADYGASDTDSNLDKATQYIIFTSNTLKNTADNATAPVTRVAIRNMFQQAAAHDVRTEKTMRDLHGACVDTATIPASRSTNKTAPYPGVGGGAYLLAASMNMARSLPLPAAANVEWFDLACYMLGSVIRSHGFTDGNGRAGRAAYAVAMLRGGVPFRPLKVDEEKLLHGLTKVS